MAEPVRAGERAAAFVAARGDTLARARAEALLGRAPARIVLERLDWTALPVSVARRTLGVCDDLHALDAPPVRTLAVELASAQAADGGWCEDRPLGERLFETGMIAGHLTKARSARPEVLLGAAGFLAAHWSPDRVRGGAWDAIAAYAHLFANVDHELADAVLQWCGRELGRGFATGAFDAVRTTRVLVHCDAHGLPGARLGPADLVAALLAEQEDDGGFPAPGGEGGAGERVGATLDGLAALLHLAGSRAGGPPPGS